MDPEDVPAPYEPPDPNNPERRQWEAEGWDEWIDPEEEAQCPRNGA